MSANLGSNVTFHWTFLLGNDYKDWNDFKSIYWGKMANKTRVTNKYITIFKDGRIVLNYQQPVALRSRFGATGNIVVSKNEYNMDFTLKNVSNEDADKYGCTASFNARDPISSGPVDLVLRGKQFGITAKLVIRSEELVEPEGLEMLFMLIVQYSKDKSREDNQR